MREKKVYLAGPITGGSWEGVSEWREYITKWLRQASDGKIIGISPLRGKRERLQGEKKLLPVYGELESSAGIITARARYDIEQCDLMLVNLNDDSSEISIGTMVEIGWASAMGKPIVVIMPQESPYNHPFVTELVSAITPLFYRALNLVVDFLWED